MQDRTVSRPPSPLLALIAGVLVAASIPAAGLLGVALALAGVACSVTFLVRHVRHTRRTAARQ